MDKATQKGIGFLAAAIFAFTAMDALAKHLVAIYPTVQVVWARNIGQLVFVVLYLGPRLGEAVRTRIDRRAGGRLRGALEGGDLAGLPDRQAQAGRPPGGVQLEEGDVVVHIGRLLGADLPGVTRSARRNDRRADRPPSSGREPA